MPKTTKRRRTKREKTYKKRVLIIENDEIVAKLMKEILEERGFEVKVARDGVEGLEKVKQNGYDVIISDCDMPRMRGDKLYLEVKKLSPDLAKRIIFVSGTITDFIKSTGNRFLKKPFFSKQFIEVVEGFIASIELN